MIQHYIPDFFGVVLFGICAGSCGNPWWSTSCSKIKYGITLIAQPKNKKSERFERKDFPRLCSTFEKSGIIFFFVVVVVARWPEFRLQKNKPQTEALSSSRWLLTCVYSFVQQIKAAASQ